MKNSEFKDVFYKTYQFLSSEHSPEKEKRLLEMLNNTPIIEKGQALTDDPNGYMIGLGYRFTTYPSANKVYEQKYTEFPIYLYVLYYPKDNKVYLSSEFLTTPCFGSVVTRKNDGHLYIVREWEPQGNKREILWEKLVVNYNCVTGKFLTFEKVSPLNDIMKRLLVDINEKTFGSRIVAPRTYTYTELHFQKDDETGKYVKAINACTELEDIVRRKYQEEEAEEEKKKIIPVFLNLQERGKLRDKNQDFNEVEGYENDNNDYKKDNWDAMTDGNYGEYPYGDLDFDYFGRG